MKIQINKNEEIVHRAREALKQNNGYCPCALTKTLETKCMCKDFTSKVENGYLGECNCGLYVSVEEY